MSVKYNYLFRLSNLKIKLSFAVDIFEVWKDIKGFSKIYLSIFNVFISIIQVKQILKYQTYTLTLIFPKSVSKHLTVIV